MEEISYVCNFFLFSSLKIRRTIRIVQYRQEVESAMAIMVRYWREPPRIMLVDVRFRRGLVIKGPIPITARVLMTPAVYRLRVPLLEFNNTKYMKLQDKPKFFILSFVDALLFRYIYLLLYYIDI